MNVAVIGAHGSIARTLTPLLTQNGHSVRGLVRKESQFDDLRSDGAAPVLCDIETVGADELDRAIGDSDVVLFAAGAGPGSGPERKLSVDRDGAIKAVESAVRTGAKHFIIVSSMGADDPPADDDDFSVYLQAKAAADEAVRGADISATILRPGRLTDDAPKGHVTAAQSVERGEIPRADVAAVLAQIIEQRSPLDKTLELVSGDTPIQAALASPFP
jgi:uncharacterized protein YbjT (DUF2867 family)